MQNKKLNLIELKVSSFATSIGNKKSQTIKGGNTMVGGFIAGMVFSVGIGYAIGTERAVGYLNNGIKKIKAELEKKAIKRSR